MSNREYFVDVYMYTYTKAHERWCKKTAETHLQTGEGLQKYKERD